MTCLYDDPRLAGIATEVLAHIQKTYVDIAGLNLYDLLTLMIEQQPEWIEFERDQHRIWSAE